MALRRHHYPLIRQGWKRALLLFILYLLSAFLSGYILQRLVPWAETKTDLLSAPENLLDEPAVQLWIAVNCLVSIYITYLFRNYIDKRSLRSLGLSLRHSRQDALAGLLLGIALTGTSSLIIYYSGSLQWSEINFSPGDLFINLVLMLMIAAGEELAFRGYILKNLTKSFNQWAALGISSLLFMLAHAGNPAISTVALLNIFLAGFLMGLYYLFARNLWLPIALHFSWNFFQGAVLGFPVSGLGVSSVLIQDRSGNSLITGGDFGLEGSIVSSLMFLVTIALFYFLKMKKARQVSLT